MLDIAELQRRVSYDPLTGVLRWKADPPRGSVVGGILPTRDNGNGYIYATFGDRGYGVHRLGWAISFGQLPDEVDHRNTIKSDNRLANLRAATRSQNEMNSPLKRSNSSGFKGVGWHKDRERWRAYIQKDGRQCSLGYYDTAAEAHAAYAQAAERLFGEFARAA